ncbi:MAG TPA: tRNA pseudouridine(55) synthase TruB [Dissulfurispiraceae bacterium]
MNLVVNLNKRHSITSHDAVAEAKRVFKVRKAGHAGTLDPLATGILLVCLNEATKITGFLSDLDKEYIMTAKFGESTDTYDSEGAVTGQTAGFSLTLDDVKKSIAKFIGEIEQIPPMHSAIKVSGTPLYKIARKGVEIERRPRKVVIGEIEVLGFDSPFLTLRVSCSKGTYIRSLCNDLGNDLGVGAHVTGLVRTRVGNFTIEDSAGIDELPHKTSALHSIDSTLGHLQEIVLDPEEYRRAQNGNPVARETPPIPPLARGGVRGGAHVRLKSPGGRLFAIGKTAEGSIKIERLFKI